MLTSHLATSLLSGVDARFLLSRRKHFLHETAHNEVCGQDFWKETLLLSFSNLFFGTVSTTREEPSSFRGEAAELCQSHSNQNDL